MNKTKVQHIVPLSKQTLKILTDLKPLSGGGRYVFPSEKTPNGSRSISDAALLTALRRMAYSKEEMTVHGFRAMARTILDEVLNFRPDFIEHHKMMQAWADYLDSLKAYVKQPDDRLLAISVA